MSLIVASGLDFLVGMTAAGEALAAGVAEGALLLVEGALVAAGELSARGVGEAVFSVVTDTLGADSFCDALGDVAGVGVEESS